MNKYFKLSFSCMLFSLLIFSFYSCEKKNDTSKTYTVVFNTNGGTKIPSKSVKEGDKVFRPAFNPIKDGSDFLGWYELGKDEIFNFSSRKINSDLTIEAKWKKKKYIVSFEVRGEGFLDSEKVSWGSVITTPSPSRIGYTFVSWHTEPGISFNESNKFSLDTPIKSSLTLYAEWGGKNITTISDSVFKSYLLATVPKAFQGNKIDGGSPVVKALKKIDVSKTSNTGTLISLSGIEYFTGLESLKLINVGLTTIDLSKNINLTKLDCKGNRFTVLDLNSNKKLTDINCSSNSFLSTLTITGCVDLTHLDFSLCNISNIDLSKNTQLSVLKCSSNELRQLVLPDHLELMEMYVDQSTLTSIDVRSSKKLSKILVSSEVKRFSEFHVNISIICKSAIKDFYSIISSQRSNNFNVKAYSDDGTISASYTKDTYKNKCP